MSLIDYCWQQYKKGDRCHGCSVDEILELQDAYGSIFPQSYKEFLLCLGHGSGSDFLSDYDCFYPEIKAREPQMEAWEWLKEDQFEPLPEDAFVFFLIPNFSFSFFFLNMVGLGVQDPPVYFYTRGQSESFFPMFCDRLSAFYQAHIEIYQQSIWKV